MASESEASVSFVAADALLIAANNFSPAPLTSSGRVLYASAAARRT